MPQYQYRCEENHWFTVFNSVSNHSPTELCTVCGQLAQQVITAPLMVKCAQDVCYDSPIDGKPITSWAQQEEDLKRHDCIPYDPEMKKDQARRIAEADAALDSSVDRQVEEAIEKMP